MLLGSLSTVAPVRAQSVDELAAKWVAATGGADAWASVQSVHIRSRSEYYSFDLFAKKPNRIRIDAWSGHSSETDVRAFDGTSGWRINSQEGSAKPRSMSATEVEAMWTERDFMMELVDPKARGYKLERAGSESVGGRPASKIKFTRPDGSLIYMFLDEQTSLEVKRVMPVVAPDGSNVDIILDIGDYRRVGKLLLPHRVGPATKEYSLNLAIDDAKFRRPGISEAEMARNRKSAVTSQLLTVGTPAPEWALKDGTGRVHRSADYRGKVVVMDFWAVWCAPCHAMMPGLQKLHRELSRRGVVVLGISTFEEGGDPIRLLRDRGYDYLVLLDGDAIAEPFRVK